jgi:PhzF family phenazine biosynthesis protein
MRRARTNGCRASPTKMGLSETAFLLAEGADWRLRWFTPAVEVDLCGHATLASVHVLRQLGKIGPSQRIRFHTRSGLLTAGEVAGGIEMDFPAEEVTPSGPPPGLTAALGVTPRAALHHRLGWLLELGSETEIRAAAPDFAALKALPVRAVTITARSDAAPYDFISRFFAPAMGVPEDPVTGSAHCALGPYWAGRLNRTELFGYQASARGGEVGVRVLGTRVALWGRAVTVWRGEWLAA